MEYVTPFDIIKRELNLHATQGSVRINVTYEEFMTIVKRLLGAVAVDEDWYRKTYPDVAEGIEAGVQPAAKEHFIQHGYFEGRLPYDIPVDETWYLRSNPDVAESIARGDHLSAQDHFLKSGYAEGRLPWPPSRAQSQPMPEASSRMAPQPILQPARGSLRR
jgi:hypothetical protein